MGNFDSFLEEHFIDSNGVVYSQIDAATLKPMTDAFFEPFAQIKAIPNNTKVPGDRIP